MNLKKLSGIFIIVIVFLCSLTVSVSAAVMDKEDILSESSDFEEIKALETAIIEKARSMCRLNAVGDIQNGIVVDYENSVRVWNNFLFFENCDVSENRLEEITDACLENWYYAWQIPVYSEVTGKSVGVVVSRRRPLEHNAENLSEESKKRINDLAGKYDVASADLLTERNSIMSYVKDIEAGLPDGSQVKIYGSQPGFFQPVGAVISGKKISGLFSLGYEYEACDTDGNPLQTGKVYDYASLYPTIEKYTVNEADGEIQNGSYSNMIAPTKSTSAISLPVILIIAAALLLIAAAAILIIKRRKKSSVKHF